MYYTLIAMAVICMTPAFIACFKWENYEAALYMTISCLFLTLFITMFVNLK